MSYGSFCSKYNFLSLYQYGYLLIVNLSLLIVVFDHNNSATKMLSTYPRLVMMALPMFKAAP